MVLNTTNGMFDVWSVTRSAGFVLSLRGGSWGSAALHPRLYAVAALRGLSGSLHGSGGNEVSANPHSAISTQSNLIFLSNA